MDIGIDLGTSNTVMTVGKKVVLNEPSVIAFNRYTHEIVAIGKKAYKMTGRNPKRIILVKPLANGVISDDDTTEIMVNEFILRIIGNQLLRPRIIMCVPSFITDVEAKAIVETAINAGARKVYLIQEPIASLMGTGADISQPQGNLIIDIGGGTTDIAVISMNGIVTSGSVKTAGNSMNHSIRKYIYETYGLAIGELTTENVKRNFANVCNPSEESTMAVSGRSSKNGQPATIMIDETDIAKALHENLTEIINEIANVIEQTTPELTADIAKNGAVLTGGGSLLKGLGGYIEQETGIRCRVAENPAECVARGTAMAFRRIDTLLDGFVNITIYKYGE